jgi:prophage regulatory protein
VQTLQNILRLPRVREATGYSTPHIYTLMNQGKFPRPVPLAGGGAVGWLESEIIEWQKARIAERAAGVRRKGVPRSTEPRTKKSKRPRSRRRSR